MDWKDVKIDPPHERGVYEVKYRYDSGETVEQLCFYNGFHFTSWASSNIDDKIAGWRKKEPKNSTMKNEPEAEDAVTYDIPETGIERVAKTKRKKVESDGVL